MTSASDYLDKLHADPRLDGWSFSIKMLDADSDMQEMMSIFPDAVAIYDSYEDLAESLSAFIKTSVKAKAFSIIVDKDGNAVGFEARYKD